MISELGPSETVSKFVSGGPKNYAYMLFDTVTGTVEKSSIKSGV